MVTLQNSEQYPLGHASVLRQMGSLLLAVQLVFTVHGCPVGVVPGVHAASVWQLGSSQSTKVLESLSMRSSQMVSGGTRSRNSSNGPKSAGVIPCTITK